MSYTPPRNTQLAFAFDTDGYTPPAHDRLIFPFGALPGQVNAGGDNYTAFGTADAGLYVRHVGPSGLLGQRFGVPRTSQPQIARGAGGINGYAYGFAATIAFADRSVPPHPWRSDRFGTARLDWKYPDSGQDPHQLAFAFGTDGYTPPARDRLNFSFRADALWAPQTGFAAGAIGTPATIYRLAAHPAGFAPTAWGGVDIRYVPQTALPSGIAATGYGTGAVHPGRGLNAVGFQPTTWGVHAVKGRRYAYPSGFTNTAWGKPQADDVLRTLSVPGTDSATLGKVFIAYRVRTVAPRWTAATGFGQAHIDRTHYVGASGWRDEAFGAADYIGRPRAFVDLLGPIQSGAQPSAATVKNEYQYAEPSGIAWAPEAARFGRTTTWNVRQVVQQSDANYGAIATPVVAGPYVVNKNRTVTYDASDWAPQTKFGAAYLRNNGRFISFYEAFWDTSAFGQTRIAPAVRTFGMQGFAATRWGTWLAPEIRNAAQGAYPPGWRDDTFGTAFLWRNLQTKPLNGWDSASLGRAFVAYRVRTVQQFGPGYPINAYGTATVRLDTQIVAPAGISLQPALPQFGYIDARIHHNIAQVWGAAAFMPGTPTIGNKTPELRVSMGQTDAQGQPNAYLRQVTYRLTGRLDELWGQALVDYRTQRPVSAGWRDEKFGLLLAYNVRPDLPPDQTVRVSSGTDDHSVDDHFGAARVWTSTVYVPGWQDDRFGKPGAKADSVFPHSILPPYNASGTQFGTPTIPRALYISRVGLQQPVVGEVAFFGTAFLWPHTLWAPMGYPYPENAANPVHNQQIDETLYGRDHPERPRFGSPRIEPKVRTLWMLGLDAGRFGALRISTNPQYAYPSGSRFTKYGFPELNAGGTTLCWGAQDDAFGSALLARAPYWGPQTVPVAGAVFMRWGAARVSTNPQYTTPRGWVSFVMSARPWVSRAPILAYPPGIAATGYGLSWASYRIRTVYPQGASVGNTDYYGVGDFSERMRVWERTTLVPKGFGGAVFGKPGAQLRMRYVQAQSRRPALDGWVGRPRVVSEMQPLGWFDEVTGAPWYVDAAVAGTLRAKGVDTAAFGRAIFDQRLYGTGFTGGMGDARMQSRLGPAGIAPGSVGRPIMVAAVCGNKNVVVPYSLMGSSGKAKVAHG